MDLEKIAEKMAEVFGCPCNFDAPCGDIGTWCIDKYDDCGGIADKQCWLNFFEILGGYRKMTKREQLKNRYIAYLRDRIEWTKQACDFDFAFALEDLSCSICPLFRDICDEYGDMSCKNTLYQYLVDHGDEEVEE